MVRSQHPAHTTRQEVENQELWEAQVAREAGAISGAATAQNTSFLLSSEISTALQIFYLFCRGSQNNSGETLGGQGDKEIKVLTIRIKFLLSTTGADYTIHFYHVKAQTLRI